MTYTPINWQTGDTITAEKMNKMDNGWAVESTQLFSETVTTEAGEYGNEGQLTYSSQVSSPTITVTFDGTDYQCSVVQMEEGYGYGGVTSGWEYDFTIYPFAFVFSNGDGNVLATENAGAYLVAVSTLTVEVSSQFAGAVNSAIPGLIPTFKLVKDETTIAEYKEARNSNRFCYMYEASTQRMVTSLGFPSSGKTPLNLLPAPEIGSFAFDSDGVLRFYD